MNITLKDGAIALDVHDLLCQLSGEALMHLIGCLAIQDHVVQSIGQQIVHGIDDNGYGAGTFGVDGQWPTPLMVCRRYLALQAGDVARKEIERLQEAVDRQRADIESMRNELSNLRFDRSSRVL